MDSTPKPETIVIKVPRIDAGDLAADLGRGMVEYWKDPANRAGFAGALVLPLLIFAPGARSGRIPPWWAVYLVAMIGHQGGRGLYLAGQNLDTLARAAQAARR